MNRDMLILNSCGLYLEAQRPQQEVGLGYLKASQSIMKKLLPRNTLIVFSFYHI